MRKIKALIVEDSKIMRSAVKIALYESLLADFEYIEAKNGVDALEKFSGEIDIMFVDLHMPKMNGLEFVQAVRERVNSHVPIIMVTADKSMGKMEIALNEAGADEYLTKPFTAVTLQMTIGSYFDGNGNMATRRDADMENTAVLY